MEVSNTTGGNTDYRNNSNPPKGRGSTGWIAIAPNAVIKVPDPILPFILEFRVGGIVVMQETCNDPMRRLSLVKTRGKFQVRKYKKPRPPARRRPDPPGDGPRPTATRA